MKKKEKKRGGWGEGVTTLALKQHSYKIASHFYTLLTYNNDQQRIFYEVMGNE